MSTNHTRHKLHVTKSPRNHASHARASFALASSTRVCYRSTSGHTIVEVMVVVVLVGTLLSISLISLSTARATARLTLCTAGMRSCLALHFDHAASRQDRFVNAGPDEHLRPSPSGTLVRVGGTRGYPNGMWALAFPDEWAGPTFGRHLRCPRDPAWSPISPGLPTAFPAFWMSMSLWLDPATLRDPSPPDSLRWRSNRVGDVLFPSQKVLLFEHVAFCTADPRAANDIQIGHTIAWPASVGFVDGSVRRFARSDGLPGHHSLPFDATVGGVEGRDVR